MYLCSVFLCFSVLEVVVASKRRGLPLLSYHGMWYAVDVVCAAEAPG